MSTTTCTAEGCPNPLKAKGLCATHYMRLRRTGTIDLAELAPPKPCAEDGCDDDAKTKGYCRRHYQTRRVAEYTLGECNDAGCDEPAIVRDGPCRKHYMRLRRKGSTDDRRKNAVDPDRTCAYDDCDRPVFAYGLCAKHRSEVRRLEDSYSKPPGVCVVDGVVLPRGRSKFCSQKCHDFAKPFETAAHGATLADYLRLLGEQSGRCAICGTTDAGGRGRFHVDHDHASGVVRGLLCNACNYGLGQFRDDPALLRAAADYVERHR